MNKEKMGVSREDKRVKKVSVRINEGLASSVDEALRALKERGVVVDAQELLSPIMETIDEKWLENRIEEMTPPEYILEIARQYPDVIRVLTTHAKRLIESAKNGETVALRVRRKNTNGAQDEANETRP